ncbi:MAG: 5'-methylthioadenosine/S-adenosylhomocysteine nucleosidase [Alphaproteobacteria bacterium]|nr:5'-methylthioadenosine/S-adenosylhomocysteine nucleosidase [Alphaproteobacteria bacterium]
MTGKKATITQFGAIPCARAVLRCLAVAIGSVPLLAAAVAPVGAHDRHDVTPRTAVISAFVPEMTVLRAELEGASEHSLNGVAFATGTLEDRDVVLFLSGISVVNAAMTVQLALDHFAVKRILFTGIAGGVDPGLNIGDVVIADRWAQYLEMLFARQVGGGWATMPFFEYPYANFGMMFPRSVTVTREGAEAPETRFWFPADEEMLAGVRRVAPETVLARCAAEDRCLRDTPRIVVGGAGVSGGAFVDNAAFRIWVFETFDARVLDMESASVAHVAYANGVPFIAVRSLADLAGGGEGANQMEVFLELAAGNAARVVKALLRELPKPD